LTVPLPVHPPQLLPDTPPLRFTARCPAGTATPTCCFAHRSPPLASARSGGVSPPVVVLRPRPTRPVAALPACTTPPRARTAALHRDLVPAEPLVPRSSASASLPLQTPVPPPRCARTLRKLRAGRLPLTLLGLHRPHWAGASPPSLALSRCSLGCASLPIARCFPRPRCARILFGLAASHSVTGSETRGYSADSDVALARKLTRSTLGCASLRQLRGLRW